MHKFGDVLPDEQTKAQAAELLAADDDSDTAVLLALVEELWKQPLVKMA